MTVIEQYLAALDDLVGGAEAAYYQLADKKNPPPLTVIRYEGVPESDTATAFSFGVSSLDKPRWKHGRPELMISVNSLDTSWALAMGELILRVRGESHFELGRFFDFGERIADESEMTSFFLFSSSLLDPEDSAITLDDRRINLVQLYPAYAHEYDVVREKGIEAFFFESKADFTDVRRRPVSFDDV